MHCGCTAFQAPDMHLCLLEVYLIPLQVDRLGDAQTVAVQGKSQSSIPRSVPSNLRGVGYKG